ncbi:SAM-dependent methyltransferase [Haloferula chungangensis]|uniref:SAM-dependent methyltransferase n=1 Tax=Haloferula chungangensis TaxID=1048331 RepID=A0ABW2L9P5_9BACT
MSTEETPKESPWLIRISKHFADFTDDVIAGLEAKKVKSLGEEYTLIQCRNPSRLQGSDASHFVRWNLPMSHVWPCNPQKMEGFIEKAAQTLHRKFSGQGLQGVFVGILDPSARDGYYKALATNLRGRTLQIFDEEAKGFKSVEEQDASKSSLFCMVGKEGLYCGVQSPKGSNGFYPGGTKFISQKADHTISRAGAKIAEALHYLPLHRPVPPEGGHWLELGACPGGMSSELLERGYEVTAIDRAPLDQRLDKHRGLHFIKADVAEFEPSARASFDALLCDMNGETPIALGQVIRLSKSLKPGGLVVFTLKTAGVDSYAGINQHFENALNQAVKGWLKLIAATHLTYNRNEFTLFFERREGHQPEKGRGSGPGGFW